MSSIYDDIIDMPHWQSKKHPRMSQLDRAAQFAPYAALVGFGGVIHEFARDTEERVELDEQRKAILDMKLQILAERERSHPQATITFFLPDPRKEGGSYEMVSGKLAKIDGMERVVLMEDGTRIMIDQIRDIDAEDMIMENDDQKEWGE